MKRRKFLKLSALATGSFLVPNFLYSFQKTSAENFRFTANNRKLIVIQLSGGNDGLNTIIPYRNDIYYKQRPGISFPAQECLQLNDELALNPVMSEFQNLFHDGSVGILNNVGYPNPDRSHFRSMDIWQTGSGSNEVLSTGWLGRYIDSDCETCGTSMSALELDDNLSLALKGEKLNGIAFNDATGLKQMITLQENLEISSNRDTGNYSLHYLYKTFTDSHTYLKNINDKIIKNKNTSQYPNNAFANDLKLVATLINAGAETSVFYVSLAGFDTHIGQKGKQNNLLKIYSDAITAFCNDLKKNNNFDDVLIFTFSEFGRRVKQNGSNGTDHGTANNVFLIGGKLKQAGILNDSPDLEDLDQGDLKHRIDFRSVYSTILNKWLNANDQIILNGNFPHLNFI